MLNYQEFTSNPCKEQKEIMKQLGFVQKNTPYTPIKTCWVLGNNEKDNYIKYVTIEFNIHEKPTMGQILLEIISQAKMDGVLAQQKDMRETLGIDT